MGCRGLYGVGCVVGDNKGVNGVAWGCVDYGTVWGCRG